LFAMLIKNSAGVRFLLFGVACAVSLPSFAADTSMRARAEALLASLKSNHAPGAAVLVVKDGRVEFEQGYGVKDLRTREPITAYTNFRLASVTKQFTAMAIMLLVHDGKLRYDDRLTTIFPQFPSYGQAISVRNLLNHTSGLQDYEDLMEHHNFPRDASFQISDQQVLELLEEQSTIKFPPGKKWEYSNSGYVLLGLIAQKVSGKPFGESLQERIFVPLGMDHTLAYQKGKNVISHRAYGYSSSAGGWRETDQSSTSATLGDGGVYSSLADLAKWDQALRTNRLLSQAEMQAALTPVQVPGVDEPGGAPAAYGFGWFLNPYKAHPRMWHYGETVGFRTAIERFVADNLTVIVLANRADLNANRLALQLADIYLGR
jgi:CubicO group peptidase (beta-lactamase class C family)